MARTRANRRTRSEARGAGSGLRDRLELVRRLRRFANQCGRELSADAMRELRWDVELRVAAIDPSWVRVTAGELRASGHDREATGVRQLIPSELSVEDRRLATMMGEIRRLLARGETWTGFTADLGERIRRVADDLCGDLASPALPLTPQERRIWELLLMQPEDRPLTCRVIVARLRAAARPLSEENARRSLATTLKAKGVRNRRGAGYFIPREFRPLPAGEQSRRRYNQPGSGRETSPHEHITQVPELSRIRGDRGCESRSGSRAESASSKP